MQQSCFVTNLIIHSYKKQKHKTMKKTILLLSLLIVGLTSFSQTSGFTAPWELAAPSPYSTYNPPKGLAQPELYLPVTILVTGYATNHYLGTSVTYGTRTTIALTSIVSAATTHFVLRSLRENHVDLKRKLKHIFN